jgi:hypothetical protein
MTVGNEKNNLKMRLSAMEIRMASVESQLNILVGSAARKSKKRSTVEKEKIKAELLKIGPYDRKKLDNLKTTDMRMLASALEIKSFGTRREDLIKAILSKQKK